MSHYGSAPGRGGYNNDYQQNGNRYQQAHPRRSPPARDRPWGPPRDPRRRDSPEPDRAGRSSSPWGSWRAHDDNRSRGRGYEDSGYDRNTHGSPPKGNYGSFDQRSRSRSRERHHGSRGKGGYYDRDNPQDSRRRSRSRSRSPYYGGAPSRDVILEGLAVDLGDDEIIEIMRNDLKVKGLEKITLIRDKKTGLSRQFAFARFADLDASAEFMSLYYPTVAVGPTSPSVRVAYSKERDADRGRGGDADWRCRVCLMTNFPKRTECFKCNTPRSEISVTGQLTHPTPITFANDGFRDIAENPPSQFLLLRGLSEAVNEEMLFKGALKLTDAPPENSNARIEPGGAKAGSIRRVLLVRDRKTDESWRFGFVEFASFDDSQAALEKYNRLEKYTIASKPVTASYIHSGVFVPVHASGKEAEQYTVLPYGGAAGVRFAYWDEGGFLSQHALITPEQYNEMAASQKDENGADSKKGKKRKAEAAQAGTNKKALPAHLQFWQNRHSELHGVRPKPAEDPDLSTSSQPASSSPAPELAPPTQSYADLNRLCCYLCARKFTAEAEVHKHERLSSLHRTNLASPALITKALQRLSKAGIKPEETYRDRAKERRSIFGQPKKAPHQASFSNKSFGGSQKKEEKEKEPEKPAITKGAALLGKMGWSQGQGLGSQGTGIVAPVMAEAYVEGVGLGAQGGKLGDAVEAASNKGGYQAFVQRTKDRARERYEGMN